jgi:hypothetical protein
MWIWRQPLTQQSLMGAWPKREALPVNLLSSLRHYGRFSGGLLRRRWRFAGRSFGCRSRPARGSSFISTPTASRLFGLLLPRPCRSVFSLILRARSGSPFLRGFCGGTVGGLADGAGRGAGPRQDQDRYAPRLYRGDGFPKDRRTLSVADSFRRRACAGTDAVPRSPVHAPDAAFRGRHLCAPKGQAAPSRPRKPSRRL